jgi:hypothetical protein
MFIQQQRTMQYQQQYKHSDRSSTLNENDFPPPLNLSIKSPPDGYSREKAATIIHMLSQLLLGN